MNEHGNVHRVSIGGGIKIASDGTYSSEYTLPQIHAACADALVAMDFKRAVIHAFRKAHDYPDSGEAGS